MSFKEQVIKLLNEAIDGTDVFLVELTISPSNSIQVFVDTMQGITIEQCVQISRHIEHNLDRDEQDFELRVSSPGLDMPLKIFEQYKKNVGRELKVQFEDGRSLKGILLEAENEKITLETRKKEKVEGKKKKQVMVEKLTINISEITSAKVIISFK